MELNTDYESSLINKSYWEEFYDNELDTYKEVGYRGEEWFEEYIDSIINWIKEIQDDKKDYRILDIGCGNGLFLIKLLKYIDFKDAVGIDYIPSAIELAKKITIEENLSEKISFYSIDLISGKFVGNNELDIKKENDDIVDMGKFDIIVDKGTFDIFIMKNERELYKQSIKRYLRNGSIIFITSCNSTPNELIEVFEDNINFFKLSDLPHKSYSYNGIEGQALASVAFKYVVKN